MLVTQTENEPAPLTPEQLVVLARRQLCHALVDAMPEAGYTEMEQKLYEIAERHRSLGSSDYELCPNLRQGGWICGRLKGHEGDCL